MSAIDKATALGTEHGTRDAEEWWPTGQILPKVGPQGVSLAYEDEYGTVCDYPPAPGLPEPDLSGDYGDNWGWKFWNDCVKPFRQVDDSELSVLVDAYCDAYRQAVETTIRAKCEKVTQ